jgi:hypothetical protein
MLTNTKNKEYFEITRDAILTLKASENLAQFKIYLIETYIESDFHQNYIGLGCELIFFNDDFSFSKTMNYALRHGINKYALLTNNDVKFDKNWFDEIYKHLNYKDVAVWSTFDPNLNFNIESNSDVIEGYRPTETHSGWCYLIDTEKLGNNRFLSEEFDLWFMDDDFCMRLQELNLKQVLCKNSVVYHLNGKSNELIVDFQNRTQLDRIKFINKYRDKIRLCSVQFLADRTIINFESFSDGEYEFKITGDVNYQTKINMSAGIYYYISVAKSNFIKTEFLLNGTKIQKNKYLNNFSI